LTESSLKHAISRKDVPFVCQERWSTTFRGGQISQKPSKGAFLGVFSVGEQNEEEWRHRRITSLASA